MTSAKESLILDGVVELIYVLPSTVSRKLLSLTLYSFATDGAVLSVVLKADLVAEVLSTQVERLVYLVVSPINSVPN